MIPKEILKKVRKLEIRTRGLVANLFGGEYHSAFKGRGMEFVEVRPYQFGDDIRNIDWNVSARSGDETYVKVFQEEREQTLMLAVDVSGSLEFGANATTKRERAAEICAVLAFSALQNNDKVGLLLFSDHVERFVPPQKGHRHVLRIMRDLYAHQPQSTKTRLSVAFEHLLHVLRRRSIVLILSDFMDEDFDKPLRALARRHDTRVIRLWDKREAEIPEGIGLIPWIDAETGEQVWFDSGKRSANRALVDRARARRKQLAARFKQLNIASVDSATDTDYIEDLHQLFHPRHPRR